MPADQRRSSPSAGGSRRAARGRAARRRRPRASSSAAARRPRGDERQPVARGGRAGLRLLGGGGAEGGRDARRTGRVTCRGGPGQGEVPRGGGPGRDLVRSTSSEVRGPVARARGPATLAGIKSYITSMKKPHRPRGQGPQLLRHRRRRGDARGRGRVPRLLQVGDARRPRAPGVLAPLPRRHGRHQARARRPGESMTLPVVPIHDPVANPAVRQRSRRRRRSPRSRRRSAPSRRRRTRSSSPTTTSSPRSRGSPTTWATRSASPSSARRCRSPPSSSAASTSWPSRPRSSRPEKRVLLPNLSAGCSLADSITAESLEDWKERYPDHAVVTYVNSTAEVKALSDICCTSANAASVVRSLPAEEDPLHARQEPRQVGRVEGARRRRSSSTTAAARSTTCSAPRT